MKDLLYSNFWVVDDWAAGVKKCDSPLWRSSTEAWLSNKHQTLHVMNMETTKHLQQQPSRHTVFISKRFVDDFVHSNNLFSPSTDASTAHSRRIQHAWHIGGWNEALLMMCEKHSNHRLKFILYFYCFMFAIIFFCCCCCTLFSKSSLGFALEWLYIWYWVEAAWSSPTAHADQIAWQFLRSASLSRPKNISRKNTLYHHVFIDKTKEIACGQKHK